MKQNRISWGIIVISFLSIIFSSYLTPLQSIQASEETNNQIIIKIHHHKNRATLNQSTAAHELYKRLPLKLRFRDFNQAEKIADLKQPLSVKQMPVGANPRIGDLGYWSPQPRLVLYYGPVAYFRGIHLLGNFQYSQRVLQAIKRQRHPFTVIIMKD